MKEVYTPDNRSFNNQQNFEDAIPKPNLSAIESKDPSLEDGYKIIYNKEVPLDIKLETEDGTKDIASYELVRCKLLSNASSPNENPTQVKIELSRENDLLFHYTNVVDEQAFLDMKKKQNLNIDYPQYCNLVTKILEDCISSPNVFIGEFTIQKDVSKLQFIIEISPKTFIAAPIS